MSRVEVHKFGGTSVGDAQRMQADAKIIAEATQNANVVVVASAMTRVTDALIGAAHASMQGDKRTTLDAIDALELMPGGVEIGFNPACIGGITPNFFKCSACQYMPPDDHHDGVADGLDLRKNVRRQQNGAILGQRVYQGSNRIDLIVYVGRSELANRTESNRTESNRNRILNNVYVEGSSIFVF